MAPQVIEDGIDKICDGLDKVADWVDDYLIYIIGVVAVAAVVGIGFAVWYTIHPYDDGLSFGKVTGKHMDNGYTSMMAQPCGKSTCVIPYYVEPAFYLHIVNAHKEGEHKVPQDQWMKCKRD